MLVSLDGLLVGGNVDWGFVYGPVSRCERLISARTSGREYSERARHLRAQPGGQHPVWIRSFVLTVGTFPTNRKTGRALFLSAGDQEKSAK